MQLSKLDFKQYNEKGEHCWTWIPDPGMASFSIDCPVCFDHRIHISTDRNPEATPPYCIFDGHSLNTFTVKGDGVSDSIKTAICNAHFYIRNGRVELIYG